MAFSTSNAAVGSAVPTGRVWVIKQITICNTSGVEALAYLCIGTSATPSNCFMYGLPIASKDTVVFDTGIVMTAAEQLFGYADQPNVTVIINGWEKEV